MDYRLRTGNHAVRRSVTRSAGRDGMLFASKTAGVGENVVNNMVNNMVGMVGYKQTNSAYLDRVNTVSPFNHILETGHIYAR